MVNVTAATSFLGNEGMWRAGDTKSVSAHRAHELIEEGLVIESKDQAPASSLQQVADALGATIKTTGSIPLQPVADALGAKVEDKSAVTFDSLKENSDKHKIKEDKAASERKTKEDKAASERQTKEDK